MLCLHRKTGEQIVLTLDGREIARIDVCKISDGQVVLGLTCPKEVAIIRPDAVCKVRRETR